MFVPGQKVEVFKTKVVEVKLSSGAWSQHGFVGTDGVTYLTSEWAMHILEPCDWPPLPGDVWEAEDNLYMVYKSVGILQVRPSVANGATLFTDGTYGNLDRFMELNPVLKFRKKEDAQ